MKMARFKCGGPSSLHLLGIISVLYLLVIWFAYRQVERTMDYQRQAGKVFRPQMHQDWSFQLYAKECPVHHDHHHGHLSRHMVTHIPLIERGTCPVADVVKPADIQMEDEWDGINVAYPQYVYTVSGWVQVINVPNYTPKPLRVIILPHSHQDPGWKQTHEGYYSSFTKQTLNNIVEKLTKNPRLKFIWSEVVFLEEWYHEPDTQQEKFLRLVKNGQLEIVTGGWVMTDEAVAHYSSMLNQLIDGHLWIKDTLGIVPNTSWSVDPFGHSPTMTYLLKRAGIDKMVIQRTHFGIKRHLAKQQSLEFMWRQAWDSSGKTDVLCHMMPFLLYAISYSCGPDPHVCCQFDFHSSKCYIGTETKSADRVSDKNIRKLSWALWEQLQKKAQLYQSNVLLVPHGDDFRYSSRSEWSDQFDNLDQLMAYMNKDEDMNIQLEYGTVSDYFKALSTSQTELNIKFPSLSGDFFPYNDRDDQYWTGFYSVRPQLKSMVRVLQAKLRITEILFSLICSQNQKRPTDYGFYEQQGKALKEVRKAVNLFQHHDAVTGTSKRIVMDDYKRILKNGMDKVDNLFLLLIGRSVVKKFNSSAPPKPDFLGLADPWRHDKHFIRMKYNEVQGNWMIIVTNPMSVRWKSPITVRTVSPGVVKTLDNIQVPSQVNPFWLSAEPLDMANMIARGKYSIVFEADLDPLSVKTYMFVEQLSGVNYAQVTLYGQGPGPDDFLPDFKAKKSNAEMFQIENGFLKASFSSCTGTLQYLHRKWDDQVHQTSIKLVTYGTGSWSNPFRDKSGAYIFMPDGQAEEVNVTYPAIITLEGPVMSSVSANLPGVYMTSTLYNISGPIGAGVHVENLAFINDKKWNNKEIAMRVISDVVSPDRSVCVDVNGFQMHKKKWRSKLLIQGNFHPVTSAAFIENGKISRLTMLTSESHGMASLSEGWLEAILDRRMMQDDWRGLNEGPHDNAYSPSSFFLVPERRDSPGMTKGPTCRLSMLAHLLSEHLNNPSQVVFTREQFKLGRDPKAFFHSNVPLFSTPLPCPFKMVHLRYKDGSMTESKGFNLSALLILHRVGVDCNYSQLFQECQMSEAFSLNKLFGPNIKLKSAMETSLTGVRDVQDLKDFEVAVADMEMKTIRLTFKR